MTLRGLGPDDFAWVLALNADNEVETSRIDQAWLGAMARQWLFAAALPEEAFLIAFAENAAYESANFQWFRQRYEAFAYIDRVVVAAAARGKGHARTLYDALFGAAAKAGLQRIVCEVNLDPPNGASDAFHARMDFAEVGRATLANGKTVRYLCRSL